jgi:hypothetical protein
MSNLLVNTRDQQFVLFEQLDVEKLFESEKYADFSKDVVLMVQNEAEKLAVNVLMPIYAEGDREGCTFKDGKVSVPSSFHSAFKKYVEAGWLCPTESPDVGGQGLPVVVATACSEAAFAANFPLLMYPGLTHGAARLIEKFGTEEQKKKVHVQYVRRRMGRHHVSDGTRRRKRCGRSEDVGKKTAGWNLCHDRVEDIHFLRRSRYYGKYRSSRSGENRGRPSRHVGHIHFSRAEIPGQ